MGKAADVVVGGGRGSQRTRGVGWGRLEQMGRPQGPRKAGEEGGRTAVFELRFIGNSLWSADSGRWRRIFIVCTLQEALECVWNKHCFGYNSRGAKGRKGAPNQGISSKPSCPAFSVLSLPNPRSSVVSPGDLSSVLRASQRTSGCLATGLGGHGKEEPERGLQEATQTPDTWNMPGLLCVKFQVCWGCAGNMCRQCWACTWK